MQLTREGKLERKLYSHLNKAMRDYALISDGDKILIGLSGGKDSLALVRLLAMRAKIRKPQFSLVAIHVRMKEIAYDSDTTYLREFCERSGVELIVEETEIGGVEKSGQCDGGMSKSPCFLCSWNRRKMLFTKAQELGCNKIALGHHRDDIVHTTLLNLFYQGQFSTMPVKLAMNKMPLTIIRPLCLIDEADLQQYAIDNSFRKQRKLCPHEHETNRTVMADLLRQLEMKNPEVRYNIMHALHMENKLISP
ncbi:MAG: tRNA 2-thiocytidine(32) synthetase TtcA [Bacteroidaceae bacterium]|nr:tRNA 2-thiocytidine(32) synthetase TtcA [Bacteroidaceae bacterium]